MAAAQNEASAVCGEQKDSHANNTRRNSLLCRRTKAAARAYSLFAFFAFTAELIFDRKLN
jgi:hypothetical protein